MTNEELLLRLCFDYKFNWTHVYEAISKNKDPDANNDKDFEKFLKDLKDNKYKWVTLLDPEYPNVLKNSYRPPFVIFYQGSFNKIKNVIEKQEYVYLEGPNMFEIESLKHIKLIEGGLLKIDNDTYIHAGLLRETYKLIPLLVKALVCTKRIEPGSLVSAIIGYNLMSGAQKDVYVVPTLERSANNDLINDGAFLLDCKERLL